jgi:hypothetical protein
MTKSKQTRNKAQEKNQIQQITGDLKDAEIIASLPDYNCSADQQKGHNKSLAMMQNLLKKKMRHISLYRYRNLREFGIERTKTANLERKRKHDDDVQREWSDNGARSGRNSKIFDENQVRVTYNNRRSWF